MHTYVGKGAQSSLISIIIPTAISTILVAGFVIGGRPDKWNSGVVIIAIGYCIIVTITARVLSTYPSKWLAVFSAAIWAILLISSTADITFAPDSYPHLSVMILEAVSRRLLAWVALTVPLVVTIKVVHPVETRIRLLDWIFACIVLTLIIFVIGLSPTLPWARDHIVTIPSLVLLVLMPFRISYNLQIASPKV